MENGVQKIYVLTHPRHWHPAPVSITLANLQRMRDELRFWIARRRRV
jgi:hypothetical protein